MSDILSSKKERKIYLDIVRIIAIILVLLTHQGTYNFFLNDTSKFLHIFSMIVSIICKCGPPLFFMVSGALLLGKNESFMYIFKHRILRFIIVIMIASLWISRTNFEVNTIIINFFQNCNWYLYSYVAFLLMIPFLRKMILNFEKSDFTLFISMSAVAYTVSVLFDLMDWNSCVLNSIPLLSSGWASNCWHLIFPIYGYYLFNNNIFSSESKRNTYFLIVSTIISIIACGLLLYYDVKYLNSEHIEIIRQRFIIAPCFLIFEFAKYFDKVIRSKKFKKLISAVWASTFGLYLLEVFTPMTSIIYNNLGYRIIPYVGVYLSYWISVLIWFIIGIFITFIFKQIPGFKKLL